MQSIDLEDDQLADLEEDSKKLKEIEADYQNDFENFVVKGLDISDISNIVKGDEVQERIFNAAETNVKAMRF